MFKSSAPQGYTPKVLNSNKWQMASSSHLDKRWLTEKHEDVLEITGITGIFG
jgi:hypothetical protein